MATVREVTYPRCAAECDSGLANAAGLSSRARGVIPRLG